MVDAKAARKLDHEVYLDHDGNVADSEKMPLVTPENGSWSIQNRFCLQMRQGVIQIKKQME